ncbi:hypothetical protein [Flavobacterium glaciei]|uniref:Uncharacterized protein n=1 Tax=Flavobacterium glaciei TaxID=386300 RepID=A0A562PRB5_9FLAO|nr:hypothetical protein [Flavobacterium glaciei]RDI53759.1 hypothetical protein DFR66_108109 [Flavobacterium glaciei]TWI46985.1 hypothetical protein IQ02_01819 [Flavobacterium glaciei]
MYKESFKDLVNFAVIKSNNFYNNPENVNSPNPYFIGFGNPNAKILILGKEKGFDKNNLKQLEYESINNPREWDNYIKNNIGSNKNKFYDSENYINTFFPYLNKNKSGHTWNKYYTLLNHIYTSIPKSENEFFRYAFLSEINFIPSKYSEIKRFDNFERLNMLNNKFFKSFEIIILACGSYLEKEQIENIFSVSYYESILKKRENIHIYQNSNQILINTRQLSMDTSNDLLIKIAELTKNKL